MPVPGKILLRPPLPVARELFLDRGEQNRERQIDGIFIEFGVPEISVL